MELDIKLSLDKEFAKKPNEYTGTKLASGYVEVNSAFKFPVSVLKKKDEATMFVKYPDIQDQNGEYNNVVFPVDKELREKVNIAVLEKVKNEFLKGLDNPEIDQVRVNVLQEEIKSGKVTIIGYASIMISGFAINGITIKEGASGPFVQMPQKRDSSGQYHDMVYGTNALMQIQIKEAVLKKYHEELSQRITDKEKEVAEKIQEQDPFLEVEKAPKV